ncbi:MAG: TonB-dependent receptor [Deltaproteobacteria bacterium]|nr:TonB-dependent receptor [Kofleriaceae bacterium]
MRAAVGLVASLTFVLPAAAQPAGGDGEIPRVEVDDLPPLPDEGDLGADTTIAAVAAAAAEEDVVVGAAKREQSLGNVASAVTVISGDRLRRMGYRTVAEALRGVAGVFIADDHMTERVGVRGVQVLGDFNTRILVLIDGATVNEPWGHFAGVGWDAAVAIDEIARIEVIRGPVSSVYGTNAFFGIINVVTRGAAESPRAWGRFSASQYAAASAAAGFATGEVDEQLRGSVAALSRTGETLTLPELGMPVDADGVDAINAGVVGRYHGAFGQVRFYRRRRELPYAPYDTEIGNPGNKNHDTQLMVEGGYTRDLGERVTATARAYVNRYRFRDFLVLEDGSGTFTDIGDALWSGVEVRARVALTGDDRYGVTAGGETTFIDTSSDSYFIGDRENGTFIDTPLDTQGLYAEVDGQPLPWFAFTGGVRADRSSVLEDRVSPRAALFASKKDSYGVKLLYSEGFRNPSAFEAFFDDGTDFAANELIAAEVIRSYEVVLWGRPLRGLTVRASGFLWDASGLVEQEEIDLDPDPGVEELRLQFQNARDLRSAGVEIEGSYRSSSGWLAFGGGAYTKVEDGAGAAVPGAPEVSAVLGVSSPLLADRVHLSGEAGFIGPRPTRDDTGMTEADAHLALSLAAYAPDVRGFDLTVGVRNLLGAREDVPAPEDFDRDGGGVFILPGEGREVYARLGYRY